MKEGVKRVEILGERMEKVRERVRELEVREGEWVERIRRRVRWCWGVAGSLLLLAVAVALARHWPRVEKGEALAVKSFAYGAIEGLEGNGFQPDAEREPVRQNRTTWESSSVRDIPKTRAGETEDLVMRMLDEL